MTLSRHEKRSLLIQALFLWESSQTHGAKKKQTPLESLNYIRENFGRVDDVPEFEEEILKGIAEHLESIQARIATHAPDWPIEKISPTDRCILYLAIYEMMYTETPNPIIINEAVDLAKEYGGDTNYKFINGALSSLNKELEKENAQK